MLLSAIVAAIAIAAPPSAAPGDTVPLYDDLGDLHRPVTTSVTRAQLYFDQGLRLYYAFNHPEAIRAFREASRLDPDCAFCFYGEALAWGPNINMPMDSAGGVAAYAALQRAIAVKSHASGVERALIDALAARYAPPELAAAPRSALDSAYSNAMANVVQSYPNDQDVQVLFAESVMDLSPWEYWTPERTLRPRMGDALAQLERVIAANPRHPGACHFYIHAVEAAYPERAVQCAERLASLMPGAGHLVHMPGHIYVRVGRYMDAVRANQHAVHADETFIRDGRPGQSTYTIGYYPHNFDFLAFAASMAGKSELAISTANHQASVIPVDLLAAPGMTFLQHHLTKRLQLLVRFGHWDEILHTPAPSSDLPHATAIWHYARGRALAAEGKPDEADAELALLRTTASDPRLEGARMEFNESRSVLGVAEQVLAGSIASARGDHEKAIRDLRAAVGLEDALTYGEPPEWTVPVREELGAALLAGGRAAEAEQSYRQDLERFPSNGWSLFGLAQSLRTQGKSADAERATADFRRAWAEADFKIEASPY